MTFRTAFALLVACLPLAQATSWCVAVWYPSSEHPGGATSILNNQDVIDIVHPFWYSPRPDGSLIAHRGAEDPQQLAVWREATLVILPSIFGSISDVLGPEVRRHHVREIADLVEQLGYDGIDIDYEGFALGTRDAFSLFVEELAEALHASDKLLSVTVHPKTSDLPAAEGAAAQDWARIASTADIFNIMTYDYTSRNRPPGPIAPVPWVLEVLDYAASVTDLSKVRLGLPFYGYSWLRGRPPATSVTWEAAQRVITSFSLPSARDETSLELNLELDVPRLPRQTFMVADALATAQKLDRALAAHPELAGVAIWGLGGEDPAQWEVLRRIRPAGCELRAP